MPERNGAYKNFKAFLVAIQFLTILRPAPRLETNPTDLSTSLAYFPMVGLLLGFLCAMFDWSISELWPPLVRGVLDCCFLAFMTRGLHLDGLADTADGILSSRPPSEALSIMKDSSTGALGVLTLIIVLLLKTVALCETTRLQRLEWIILAPVLSRFSLVMLAAFSNYARKTGGLGTYFVGFYAKKALVIALPVSLLAGGLLGGIKGVLAFFIACILGWFAASWFRKKLGGVTGDCLGAHLEMVETFILLFGASRYI